VVDVIIVGAGPVGLSLALGLARAGKSVVVLEKDPGLHTTSRAPIIWPRTQEILADLGVMDRFESASIILKQFTMWNADSNHKLISLPISELKDQTHFPQILILPQHKTEALLYEALKAYPSVQVHFAHEVTGLSQDSESVRVRYATNGTSESEMVASYVVGCDGAHSAIRAALGLELDGITYPLMAALADVKLPYNDPNWVFPRLSVKDVPVVAVQIELGEWRLILPFTQDESITMDERVRLSVKNLFHQADYSLIWQSEFKLHQRISPQFALGRVALAGDAAHLNSPVGGQGMNSGIQDGALLCTALVKAIDTRNPALLQPNAEMRHAKINFGVNQFTNILTRVVMLSKGRYMPWVLRILNLVLKIPSLRQKFLMKLTMLGD